MKPLIAALTLDLLADGADDGPPKRFPILKPGTLETSKGIFKFTDASASKVLKAAKRYGNDFAIDYNHAMHFMLSLDPAESGKAAGWFKAVVKDGVLWAEDVRWTPKAEQKLRDREYRYFSPTVRHSEAGEIEELLSVALTNTPATYGMDPLMASQLLAPEAPTEKQRMKTLLAMLGLAEGASEAEAVAALTKLNALFTELSTLTAQKDADAILGTLKAWKVGADQAVQLSQQMAEVKAAAAKAEVEQLISKAKTDGRLAPAMETFARTLAAEQLKTFLAALPVQPVAAPAQPPAGGTVQLTAEEIQVATMMGTPLEVVAKDKARLAGLFDSRQLAAGK